MATRHHVATLVALVVVCGGISMQVGDSCGEDVSMFQMRTSAQASIVNATAENTDFNRTLTELANKVDDIINDKDMDPFQRGLRIAKELAQELDGLQKPQGPAMIGLSTQHLDRSSQDVNGEEFAHERSLITDILKRSDVDPLSKALNLATEFAKLLDVCDGVSLDALQSSSRGSSFWGPRICSITCGGALAVVGPSCLDLGSACLPSLRNAMHACASCPRDLCTSTWSRSTLQVACEGKWNSAGDVQPLCNMCKPWQPHYEASTLSLASNLVIEPDHIVNDGNWVAEKGLFERVYQNTAMNPISRTLHLEDELAKLVDVCDASAKHTASTSFVEVEFWGWFKKASCSAGCLGAVAGGSIVCTGTGGVGCPIALLGAIGTCSGCPETFCLSYLLQVPLNTFCRPPFLGPIKPVCDFCRVYLPFY